LQINCFDFISTCFAELIAQHGHALNSFQQSFGINRNATTSEKSHLPPLSQI